MNNELEQFINDAKENGATIRNDNGITHLKSGRKSYSIYWKEGNVSWYVNNEDTGIIISIPAGELDYRNLLLNGSIS